MILSEIIQFRILKLVLYHLITGAIHLFNAKVQVILHMQSDWWIGQ